MPADRKFDGLDHDSLMAYLYDAAQSGALQVVNVRRKFDDSLVPVLGVTHLTPTGILFNPIAEVNQPGDPELYHQPKSEDNLPPEVAPILPPMFPSLIINGSCN